MEKKIKNIKIIESLGLWKDAGVTPKYLCVIVFNNLIAKGLGGIGIGLLIPLANGVIKEDFSLVTDSSIFNKIAIYFPKISNFDNIQIFLLLSVLILILNILKSVITYNLDLYQDRKNLKITSNVTRIFFKDQISLGKAFFDETNAGSYANKMSRVPAQISSVLDTMDATIGSLMEIIIYSFVLIFISPALFFFTIPFIPVVLFIIFIFKKKISGSANSELESDLNITKIFYNSIIRTPLIRIYGTELKELNDFNNLCIDFEDKKFRTKKILGFIKPIQDVLIFTTLFLVVLILRLYSHFMLGVGVASLLVFFVAFRQLLNSANSIIIPILIIPQKMAVVISVKKQLEKHSLKKEPDGTKVFDELKDSIVCKDLYFNYKPKRPVLRGISCTIPKGKITAIIGKSGSGKTTLVNLILKLYNPPPQSIFFDRLDINEYTEKSVRSPFSYVSQDILLFDDTLRNNICYGLKEAPSDEELTKILKEVNMIRVVERLDNGLDTDIGDRGVQLSGGERQRVALARALLNKSSIIIFDEPTSSVDIETELEVLELIKKYSKEKTIIIIAHSFLTIQHANHVVVIEDGKTIEEGSIQGLIDKKNVFYRFWENQVCLENNFKV